MYLAAWQFRCCTPSKHKHNISSAKSDFMMWRGQQMREEKRTEEEECLYRRETGK
jgi:hypothetical protein